VQLLTMQQQSGSRWRLAGGRAGWCFEWLAGAQQLCVLLLLLHSPHHHGVTDVTGVILSLWTKARCSIAAA
jgi:hypothetical protein